METSPTPLEALKEAVKIAGGQSATARLCNVTQPTVWHWINRALCLPAKYVLRVEAATGVSRHHLQPDIYPIEKPSRRRRPGRRSSQA